MRKMCLVEFGMRWTWIVLASLADDVMWCAKQVWGYACALGVASHGF